MSGKQKIAVSILLLVARMFVDEEWKAEIKQLANHISLYVPKVEDEQ